MNDIKNKIQKTQKITTGVAQRHILKYPIAPYISNMIVPYTSSYCVSWDVASLGCMIKDKQAMWAYIMTATSWK